MTAKDLLKKQFKQRLQKIYGEQLDFLGILYGDIEPAISIAVEDAEEHLAELNAEWLLSLMGDENAS